MKPATIHRVCLTAAIALVLGAAVPAAAGAAFGPIELLSKSPLEQAGVASEPVISADGRYVAFCATLGGDEGIFREELATGALVAIATRPGGRLACKPETSYASAPSISADGRYVSFTTKAPLVIADGEPETADVYVADLSAGPPAYRLASAVDGSELPMPGGSNAAAREGMSADGSRVAFVNGGNVYVRELTTGRTVLVSAEGDGLGGMTGAPTAEGGAYGPAGAAISADGSTVAWVGEHVARQVLLPPGEGEAIRKLEAESKAYHEPLWRRVATPAAPTRRLVGGEGGPYPGVKVERSFVTVGEASGFGWGIELPQLDADGDSAVTVANPDEQYDLFLAEMGEGPGERTTHQVTKWTNPAPQDTSEGLLTNRQYFPFTGKVSDCAISSDGKRVAFTTTRQRFSTAPYALITELPSAVGLAAELYELDLASGKIERVTPGPGKDVSTGEAQREVEGAVSPSFAADDRLVTFASEADNLVDGDGNEASDVFAVESDPPAPVGASSISPRPPRRVVVPARRMTVNAYSRPDGTVRLVATVPGAGTLRAGARAQLGTKLKTHQVAAGRRRATAAGTMLLELKLGRRQRNSARKPGLVTRVHVTFTGPGGQPLHADLQSRFLIHKKKNGKPGKGAMQ